ncbi:MAG: hypothetical protein IJX44_04905 [Bacteroidaceae bacterium]|nr:hypothetical protein [Bacteroidaceae bacterium]
MKRYIIFIGIFILTQICLVAQTNRTYTVKFDREDFSVAETQVGDMISSNKHHIFFEENTSLPAIPYRIINILLPEYQSFKNFTFTVDKTLQTTDVTLASNPVCITTDTDPDSISVPLNEYPLKDYPLNVELLDIRTLECYRYARFKVPLIAYNPIDKLVTWATQISISIETEEKPFEAKDYVRLDVVKNMMQDILLNPEEIYEPQTAVSVASAVPADNEGIKYLIITSNELKSSFRALANWKTTKGVKTKIVTIEEIYEEYASEDTSNQLKIKQCIYDYYKKGLEYVLLGGDEHIVPVQGCYAVFTTANNTEIDRNMPTDLFYANFEGNLSWNNDGDSFIGEETDISNIAPYIAIGRFPIFTATQARKLVTRTIEYEKNPIRNSYYEKMLLVAANSVSTDDMANESHSMFTSYIRPYWSTVNLSELYDIGTTFEGGADYDVNSTNLQEQIEAGYHHLHVNTHGLENCWSLEGSSFFNSHADSLYNEKRTFIATTACLTNAFDKNGRCLSEALLNSPNSGVITYLGSSRYGIGYYGSIGPSAIFNGEYYKNILKESLTTGKALTRAKNTLSNSSIGLESYRWLSYALNLMGDPELKPYTETPQDIKGITWGYSGGSSLWVRSENEFFTATLMSKADYGATDYQTKFEREEILFDLNLDLSEYQLCILRENHIPLIITDLSSTYIQNKTYTGTNIETGTNIFVGHNVMPAWTEGNVTIESGTTTFDASNSVTIKSGFKCKKGATLIIK